MKFDFEILGIDCNAKSDWPEEAWSVLGFC